MPLVDCVECGTKVSPSAHTCPRCRRAPGGGICVLCSQPIKIDDAYRIMAWQRRGSRATARMVRADKFAHKECVLELFPNIEAPCVDCGAPLDVRTFGLAARHNLMTATDPTAARWYDSLDRGWSIERFEGRGGSTCPQCGSTRVLSRSDTFLSSCSNCQLPVLTVHDAEYDAATFDWRHRRCTEMKAETDAGPLQQSGDPGSVWAKSGFRIASMVIRVGLAALAGSVAATALVRLFLPR